MRWSVALLTIFWFSALMVQPIHAEDINPKYLIVGGKSVGPVSIGMTLDEVRSVLGPESGRVSSDEKGLYRFPQVYLMIWFDSSNKVGRIMVTYSNRSYATAEGFRAGSNPNDLIRAYGKPKHEAKVTSDGEQRYLFGFNNGLMMLTDLNKTSVLTLGIYDPN